MSVCRAARCRRSYRFTLAAVLAWATSACAGVGLEAFGLNADGGFDNGLTDGAIGGGGSGGSGSGGDASITPLTRDEACARLETLGLRELDLDGDCFITSCGGQISDADCLMLRDCDEGRTDVNPLAPESCNQRDDDCDGEHDEAFEIGATCMTSCGEGKVECSLKDPLKTACSTEAGQSASAPQGALEEVCNGLDDDCNGEVDELCRVKDEAPLVSPALPVVCGERLYAIDEGVLVVAERGVVTTLSPRDRNPFAPSCGPAGVAWLELSAPCNGPGVGPEQCRGFVFGLAVDAPIGTSAAELAGPSLVGRPTVGATQAYWHTTTNEVLELYARNIDGSGSSRLVGPDLSDPSASPDGTRLAAREWHGDMAEVVILTPNAGEPGTDKLVLPNPPGHPQRPSLGSDWVVWSLSDTLWAVPLTGNVPARDGAMQIVWRPATPVSPRVDGEGVVYLDLFVRPPVLRRFDFVTGYDGVLEEAEIRPDDFDVEGGIVTFIEQTESGPVIRRISLQ